ncbi:MAG: Holliday junction resolvase RecU [Lachnospiraceae bacterium]|nr:Holliday junction resolvase RecU [Lachnospiraceae bacterium]
MATWNSRGLRGSALEEMINYTNDLYKEKHLALIQKIPTPIKPIQIEKETRHITLAYFDQKSTVDYIGTVQGIPVCFDAKECAKDTFPIANVHKHQMDFMEEFERQGGVAFLLLSYTKRDEMYYLPFIQMKEFYKRAKEGIRKSFTYEELDKSYRIYSEGAACVHYLPAIQRDLDSRDEKIYEKK